MSRLPQPGSDAGTWGAILNDFLLRGHQADGTHHLGQLLAVPAGDGQVLTSDSTSTMGVTWRALPSNGVAVGGSSGQVLQKQSSTDFDVGWRTLTKSDVGLTNADNTSDDAKPISAATQAALHTKADINLAVALAAAL